MASIVVAGDTSGTVTLTAPLVAGTTTLTLPTANGTLITTGSSGQSIPKAALPTGSILQVVQGTTGTQVESSYSSATNLGLSISITPTFATSRILVIVTPAGCGSRSPSTHWIITLRRNSTNLINFATYIGSNSANGVETYPNCAFIDSPNTTSSVSYNLIGTRAAGSDSCYFNHSDGTAVSTMVAMEIAS